MKIAALCILCVFICIGCTQQTSQSFAAYRVISKIGQDTFVDIVAAIAADYRTATCRVIGNPLQISIYNRSAYHVDAAAIKTIMLKKLQAIKQLPISSRQIRQAKVVNTFKLDIDIISHEYFQSKSELSIAVITVKLISQGNSQILAQHRFGYRIFTDKTLFKF